MAYLDMWRSGTFTQVSVLAIINTDHRTTEHSISDSLGDVSSVKRDVPLLHTSRYVTARDSLLPGLPPALVLQATDAGVRRPGYEATYHCCLFCIKLLEHVLHVAHLAYKPSLFATCTGFCRILATLY